MFDSERPDQYEVVYEELLARLAEADLVENASKLDLEVRDGAVVVPLFDRAHLVGSEGIVAADQGPVQVAHRIVLAHLLLFGGSGGASGELVPYRELRGGCDFSRNLAITVEGRLAKSFSGRAPDLRRAVKTLGGALRETESSYDICALVPALPMIPLMFTFYDADEDFPAEVKVFFDSNAQSFLDLECLAVLAMLLASELEAAAG